MGLYDNRIKFFFNLLKNLNFSNQKFEKELKEEIKVEKEKFLFNEHLIPLENGQAIGEGWPYTNGKPLGVTWHWTATSTLESCRKILGGSNATRKGQASAHFCVGRTFSEGVDVYVNLENRSWHAGINQSLKYNGMKFDGLTATRSTIGIETVNVGFERDGFKSDESWISVDSSNGKFKMKVQPWTEDQIEMMISVGKKIVEKFPHIGPEDHHGHSDICPGYKEDPSLAFPYAKILSGIYNKKVDDVWSPFLKVEQRQQALVDLGYDLGDSGYNKNGVDGDWGRLSTTALLRFQKENGLVENGYWTTFVSREIYKKLKEM